MGSLDLSDSRPILSGLCIWDCVSWSRVEREGLDHVSRVAFAEDVKSNLEGMTFIGGADF